MAKNRLIESNFLRLSELNAIRAENLYRQLHGLCPRVIPGLVGACKDPASVTCPTPTSACNTLTLSVSADTPSVTLSDVNTLSDKLHFTAVLKNVSKDPVTVSAIYLGTIAVHSVSIGKTELTPVAQGIRFDDNPLGLQQRVLKTLSPGATVSFPIEGLRTIVAQPGQGLKLIKYPPNGKGRYFARFGYSYQGSDAGFPAVFHGTVESNVVSFDVQ